MKIKKSISIILSALMVISMLICPVYADSSAAITLTGGNLQKGSKISVPIVVSGTNKGITSFNFDIVYDTDNLELTDAVIKSPDFMGFPYQKGTDYVTAMAPTPYTSSEAICTLVFETKKNVINGKYNVSLKLGSNDDSLIAYNDELITDVKVTPATITVTGGSDKLTSVNTIISGVEQSYEWTGSPIELKPIVSYNNKTLTKDTDYTVSYENNINIGTATLTVKGKGSYTGSVKKTFKITKKAADITVPTSYTMKYGDKAFSLGASVNSRAELSYTSDNSDVASVDKTGKVTIKSAGTVNITVSAPETENYQKPVDKKITVTVSKADYTVTLSAARVYVKVGTENVSFLPTASAKGVGDEQPAGMLKFYSDAARNKELTAAAVKDLNIGDYTVYWSFKTSDTNYVDKAKTGEIKLIVTDGDPQNIAISELDGKTYGDALFHAIAAVTTTDGAEAKDHGAITWSSSNTNVAEIDPATGAVTINGAGETTITAKAAKVAGKYAAGEKSATLTVAKKTLTIESITAANKTYDGKKDATLTVNVSGAVAGDKITTTATGEFADAAVGTNKAVTVKSIKLDEASSANYTTPEKLPAVKASITKIASKDVKLEYPDLNQKTGSITKPTVKMTPEDSSAKVKIFIKKTVKDETTGGEKTVTEEWTDKTAPTAAGTYIVYAEITSPNIDEKITTPDQKLTITQRSSGGGGGGAAVTTYKVTLDKATNGTVKASASSVEKGKTVTITATPAEGYETASVKVTDASGKSVDVTKNSDGTYKFTMPDGNVTVKAEFAKKAENDTVCADMKDIDQSKWYHEAVHYVVEKGIMNGYNKNEFGPNDTLSRAMLAQILYNNAGKPTASNSAAYSDIKSSDWFAPAVSWAAEKGIVTGYTDNTFRAGDSITREQLAAMLYRYAGQPATTGSLANFTDAASVSGYAQQAMQWATANGIITGNGSATTLDPQGNATRAQAAAMIMRYLEKK